MRYAIWAAVSTEQQAESDKASLPVQEETCKRAADLKGWTDTGLRFIVPGESRTRWLDLTTAARHIAALRELMQAAEGHKFDVLVLYDFNRLRDLLHPLSAYLDNLGVKLYSLNLPADPEQPDSDTHVIMEGMAGIISKLQISDLRRKYSTSMPRRVVDRGLPPFRAPYGYHKPEEEKYNRAAIPVQDSHAPVVIEIKDRLLAGQSLNQIKAWLKDSGIPSPGGAATWYPQTIRDILRNPFYAGVVRFGVTKSRRDLRTGQRIKDRRVPPDKIILGAGKHKPLWDLQTHKAILAELGRRGKAHPGKRTSTLSSLLYCGICGKPMWIFYDGLWQVDKSKWRKVYRCSSKKRHVSITFDDAVRKLGMILAELIRHYPVDGPPPPPPDMLDRQAALDDLYARRKRIEEGQEAGFYDVTAALKKVAGIDAEIEKLEAAILTKQEEQQEQQTRLGILGALAEAGDALGERLKKGDPQKTNRVLHMVIKRVVVEADGRLRVELK